jgi:quercetin dioxygenase-like cupin family protein
LSIQFQETAIFSSEDTPETTYIDREAIPLKERELKIIKRKELPELNQIQFEGGKKDLGIVKNFAESETIAEKLPAYFSAAWVHLNPGQKLDTHKHDTASLIIVTEGEGSLQGDLHRTLREGDTVHVPPGCWHGFTGAGDKGFWALSIQFQETSLYENRTKPQVQFSTPKINASMTKKTQSQSLEIFSFDQFLQRNEQLAEEFLRNPIFHIDREEIKQNPLKKQKLMDCLQVMSNSFQRLIFSRMSLCDDSDFKSVFLEHLLDEIGHDTDLEKERGKKELLWDPILHASTSWFNAKNFVVDNPARVVMVQMVLERGAFYFYSHYNRLLSQEGLESEHIKNHSIADEGHDKLGVELLEDESPKKLKSYQKLLEESWNMLELFLGRTAELVQTVK